MRGSVVLAIAVGFLSCSGDPTDSFRQPAGIVATPTTVFINVGETKPVLASLQDEQGNQIAADYEVTAVGPGISVVQDTTFLHTTAPGVSIDNQVRFQVTASAIANSSFTLTAGGKSLVVPVRVTPAAIEIAISNATPAWCDTITLTAPSGILFTDASVVTFAGGPAGDIVSLSPDRTVLTVVPGPNTAGAATITHTTVSYDESLDFTVTSNGTVTTPPLTEVAGVFSTQAPALGQTVTLTLPAGIKVVPESLLADSGLVLEGAINPADVVISPDSSTITFVPAPNSDSVLTLRGVVPSCLPQFPQILSTTLKITTPSIDSIAVVFSKTNPAVLEAITVTAPAGFSFARDTTGGAPVVGFTWGGLAAIINSIAADGKSANITPLPGSNGHASVSNVIVDAAPQFRLTLPATVPITVPTVTPLEGTESPATAPEITVPGAGGSVTVNDAGSFDYPAPIFGGAFGTFPSRLYKVVITGTFPLTVTLAWPTGQDLGAYWFNADGVGEPVAGNPADSGGGGASPEASTSTLPPGTYLLAVVNFGSGNPPVFQLTLSR
ncbi:MAG: hypothetical protein ABI037_00140 [Gemmatimonadales bacterium]